MLPQRGQKPCLETQQLQFIQKILAINIDPAANMVVKADYAVIGDLFEVLPAIEQG